MPIYAISRSRLQYLGSIIPLFRLKHSLFESLVLTIHSSKFHSEDNQVDTYFQEQFLFERFLEFLQVPSLRPLITFSEAGDALGFVDYFNGLDSETSSYYYKYKIKLYDINRRKYVVFPKKEEGKGELKKLYLVHYNGFVFPTNKAKMETIREREAPAERFKHLMPIGNESDEDKHSDIELNLAYTFRKDQPN